MIVPLDIEDFDGIPRLTFDELQTQVEACLRACAGDVQGLVYNDGSGANEWVAYEATLHGWQDAILLVTLWAIADGATDPARWASLALRVTGADYTRWDE